MTTTFTRAQIAAACRVFGGQVGPLPAGVDGKQLMWAIAGVESSFGANCTPRHEPAFDKGGAYAAHAPMPLLLARFGSQAACSYGPWQLMFCNAPATYLPTNFSDENAACRATVIFLNAELRRFAPKNLAEIGECWNAGHICPDPAYVAKLAAAYAVPMVTG